MAGTYLNFPFDEDVFLYNWRQLKDPTLTAFLDSGAMVEDSTIAGLIANGSDQYTVPLYGVLADTAPVNYNGATNITTEATAGASETGIVFGRAKGWEEKQFIRDFNSGADPMASIVSQVGRYWSKYLQGVIIGITNAVLGVTAMSSHKVTRSAVPAATDFADAAQEALGDNGNLLTLAIMHSKVANQLADLQLLQYRKYTDPMGIERQLNIADMNGMTVVVDDGMPHTAASGNDPATYTSFLFAPGALRHATAPVEQPVEVARDAATNGGMNMLYTRVRQTVHPEGFSYVKPTSGYTMSPTDAQLTASARWSLVDNAKNVGIVSITTQG